MKCQTLLRSGFVLALAALPEAQASSLRRAVGAKRFHFNSNDDPPEASKKKQSRRGPLKKATGQTLPWEELRTQPKSDEKPKFGPQAQVLFVIAPGSALLGIGLMYSLLKIDHLHPSKDRENVRRKAEGLDEDVYCAGIACIVRDAQAMTVGRGDFFLRICRFLSNILLIIFNIVLCIFLIMQLQGLVADRAVTDIRKAYGKYEWFMYGGSLDNVDFTANGFPRGKDKYFNADNFDTLPFDLKEQVCAIPFSEPRLLIAILFIWSLIVFADLRRCGDLFVRLIVATPTIDTMSESIKFVSEEAEENAAEPQAVEDVEHEIVGLTRPVKILLVATCLVPRWFIDVDILWLGSRWLVASESFSDLVLNAVALEFILLLKDTLYVCLQPDRNKRNTNNTLVQPWQEEEPANYRSFLAAFFFMVVAFTWVMYYMYNMQSVLPDYKWDVAKACKAHIEAMTSGKSP